MASPCINFIREYKGQRDHWDVCAYRSDLRPQLIRSGQFHGKRRREIKPEPLRRLMAAVLCEAVNRFQRNLFQTSSLYGRCEFVEAEFSLSGSATHKKAAQQSIGATLIGTASPALRFALSTKVINPPPFKPGNTPMSSVGSALAGEARSYGMPDTPGGYSPLGNGADQRKTPLRVTCTRPAQSSTMRSVRAMA